MVMDFGGQPAAHVRNAFGGLQCPIVSDSVHLVDESAVTNIAATDNQSHNCPKLPPKECFEGLTGKSIRLNSS